jgi:hypothetical protein
MTMSKLVGDLKTFDDFLAIAGPSSFWPARGQDAPCHLRAGKQEEASLFFCR